MSTATRRQALQGLEAPFSSSSSSSRLPPLEKQGSTSCSKTGKTTTLTRPRRILGELTASEIQARSIYYDDDDDNDDDNAGRGVPAPLAHEQRHARNEGQSFVLNDENVRPRTPRPAPTSAGAAMTKRQIVFKGPKKSMATARPRRAGSAEQDNSSTSSRRRKVTAA